MEEEFKKFENQIYWRTIIRQNRFGLFNEIKRMSEQGYLVLEEIQNRHPQSLFEESLNSTEKGEQDGMA